MTRWTIVDALPGRARVAFEDTSTGVVVIESNAADGRLLELSVTRSCASDVELRRRSTLARVLGVEAVELKRTDVETIRRTIDDIFIRLEACRGTTQAAYRSSHPNVAPLCAWFILREDSAFVTIEPRPKYTMATCLRHGFGAFRDPERKSLAAYQMCRAVAHLHEKNIAVGRLALEDIYVSTLSGRSDGVPLIQIGGLYQSAHARVIVPGDGFGRQVEISAESARRRADSRMRTDVRAITSAWRIGALSNLDYVIKLNEFAGRGKDRAFYAVAPWTIDFTAFPLNNDGSLNGARDLTRTKWRLTKGDEQLDFTYKTTTPPHHVSDDCLSELGVCIALARRLPRETLSRIVRSHVVGDEYPKDLQRLYEVSPDEAPIDFYTNPDVFKSTHVDMRDLLLPEWSRVDEGAGEYFIKIHREVFESAAVSKHLHAWIDLTFGHATFGKAALRAKNVIARDIRDDKLTAHGRVRIFDAPHPKRSVGMLPRPMTSPMRTERFMSKDGGAEEATQTVVETPLREVQRRDLQMLGECVGVIYTGKERPIATDDRVGGLFDSSPPLRPMNTSPFTDGKGIKNPFYESDRAWLECIPDEARDIVQMLMDASKPSDAGAVRDSVLFTHDIRTSATALGRMREARDSSAARILAAERELRGSSPTVAHFVLADLSAEVATYVSSPMDIKDEMEIAMCLACFVETSCGVAHRNDVKRFILDLYTRVSSAPSPDLRASGPTLKRELFRSSVLASVRKSIGSATFVREVLPLLISCLRPNFCSAEEREIVFLALNHVVQTVPIPVVVLRIVNVLRKALCVNQNDTSSGAHVIIADALSAMADVLGQNGAEHVLGVTTSSSSVLEDLSENWHRSAPDHALRPWSWFSTKSASEEELREDSHLSMSQVLANAKMVDEEQWRVHLDSLTSWRVHSRISNPTAHAMSISEDENLILTNGVHAKLAKVNNVVRVWRTAGPIIGGERGELASYFHPNASVTASAFLNFAYDRYGNVCRASSCDDKGYVHVWKTTGEHVWQFLAKDSGGITALNASESNYGRFITAGALLGGVVMADASAGKIVRQFTSARAESAVSALEMEQNGIIRASTINGRMFALDPRQTDERPVYDIKAHEGAINKILATRRDEYEILTASNDMSIGLWDVRVIDSNLDSKARYSGRIRTFRGHQSEVRDIAVNSTGDVFSVSGNSVGIFSLASTDERFARFAPLAVHGPAVPAVLHAHSPPPFSAIGLLPNSRLFALLNSEGVLSICH